MSSFAVNVVRLDEVSEHPNADLLELARVGGYRAVVRKGEFHTGDLAVYIPEQALVPNEILAKLGLEGKLSGKDKNRVKAIRLRGELSQGIVAPLSILEGVDLAAVLGIEKYEPPVPVHFIGGSKPYARPSWFPMYTDIENIKKFPNVFQEGEEVIFTEKIHGTNCGFGMSSDDMKLVVCSRRWALGYAEDNLYWRAAIKYEMQRLLTYLVLEHGLESVVIFGEVYGVGVQDLAYGGKPNEVYFRMFDLMIDREFVDYDQALDIVSSEDVPRVPFLYRGPFSMEAVDKHTSGKDSLSYSHTREGIVIRPARERWDPDLGRVILKSISPDYLLREGGTEYQ